MPHVGQRRHTTARDAGDATRRHGALDGDSALSWVKGGPGTPVAPAITTLAPKGAQPVNENDHPKGALLFMLVYLALLAFMWTNLYLKLWTR